MILQKASYTRRTKKRRNVIWRRFLSHSHRTLWPGFVLRRRLCCQGAQWARHIQWPHFHLYHAHNAYNARLRFNGHVAHIVYNMCIIYIVHIANRIHCSPCVYFWHCKFTKDVFTECTARLFIFVVAYWLSWLAWESQSHLVSYGQMAESAAMRELFRASPMGLVVACNLVRLYPKPPTRAPCRLYSCM